MADRFWVGGGASTNWNATGNTNWSATSGGANNASVPGTGDLAIFDSNSGVGNSVISANITVQGLDCTGGTGDYAGTITHNTSVTLTINTGAASSVRFSAGMTYTAVAVSSIVTLTHTSGTANITSNGKRFGSLTINGAGGTTTLIDALRVDASSISTLTVTSGIFDAGTNTCAINASSFVISGSTTRSVILGGLVKLGPVQINNTNLWNATTTTNLTFTKNSANIEILTPIGQTIGHSFFGGALTYNNLTLDATTYQTGLAITGNNTFANLAVGSGWTLLLAASSTQTVSNAFSFVGTQANPIGMFSVGVNGAGTISVASGACTLTWGSLLGVTGTGGATFTATNTLNLGSNAGWSISPPADATTAVPTVAQIATAVWQDTTAGDFTTSGSIGKDLKTGAVPGAANGLFIAGTNAATAITTGLTTTFTGNLTGSVGSATTVNGLAAGVITATSIAADAITAAKIADGAIDAATFAAGAINAAAIAADAITDAKVASDVTIASVTGAVGSVTGNVGGIAGTTQTLDALQTAQNSAHGAGSWATATGFSTHSAADVWAAGTRTLTSFGTLVADAAAAVWASVTRVLTAGTNIALAKGTGVTGFNDLDAAGVRTAVGLASANLDTQLADLPTNAELATAVGVAQTGDSFARLGAAGAGLTALGDTRLANLDAAVSTRSTFAGGAVASVTGAVGSVTGLTASDVAAIKAKTDNLPANPAAATDTMAANITQVNGVVVDGAGTVGDPWGPA